MQFSNSQIMRGLKTIPVDFSVVDISCVRSFAIISQHARTASQACPLDREDIWISWILVVRDAHGRVALSESGRIEPNCEGNGSSRYRSAGWLRRHRKIARLCAR